MTVAELDAILREHGVSGFKAVRVAGMTWAICSRGVGVGDDLATAIGHMVAIVKEAPVSVRANDGNTSPAALRPV